MSDKQPPVARIRDGAVSCAIWKQEVTAEGKEDRDFYNVTFEKTYTVDGEPKSSKSFSRNDLLRLARLANKAYDAIEKIV